MAQQARSREVKPSGKQKFAGTVLAAANRGLQAGSREKPGHFDLVNALNKLPNGICVIDTDYNILLVNQAYVELAGTSTKKAAGKKCHQVLSGPLCHTQECSLKRITDGEESVQIEMNRFRKDGSVITCALSAYPLYDQAGSIVGIIESFRDISRRQKLKGQLYEAKDLYRTIIELTDDVGESIILTRDIDGREGVVTYASNQFARLSGYTSQELEGKSFFDLLRTRDRSSSLARHRRKMKGESLPGLYEMNISRKDGSVILVELTSAVTQYQGSSVNVIFLRDISQRKQMAEQLLNHQKHLEKLVHKRTAQLTQANEELGKQVELQRELRKKIEVYAEQKNLFINRLIHELKTPLTPMMGASEMLISSINDRNLPLYKTALIVNAGARKLHNRIRDIIDISKSEISLLKLDLKPVDIAALLDEIFHFVLPEARKRKQQLLCNVPGGLPAVTADEDRIEQVILNLLDNAMRFTGAGGRITLSAESSNQQLQVKVIDTGEGIAERDKKWLFSPYYHGELNKKQIGLGLGLPLCKTIVEMHGGQIFFESRKGKGSTFGFSLPVDSSMTERKRDCRP